jgi:iron complex outermembrane recepter protein
MILAVHGAGNPTDDLHSEVSMNRTFRTVLLVTLTLIGASSAFAQQDSTVEWKVTLQDLTTRLADLSADNTSAIQSWRTDAEQLRTSITIFAASRPEMDIDTPEPLPDRPAVDALRPQLDALTAAVDQVISLNPNSPFHLGQSVSVVVAASTPTLVSASIDEVEIERHDFLNIAEALDYLPGVQTQRGAGQRNEAATMVRGFTTRGQVQFYMDGVPISIPYDGYIDFNRFLTGNVAQLQVDKGYTSPLLGPNAEGGAINIVTRVPARRLEGDVRFGGGSGDTLVTSVNLGSRTQHLFALASYDRVKVDYIPFSGDFQVNQYKNLPHITMTDHQNHSATLDDKFNGRLGWTPRTGDEYVVSYSRQRSDKSGVLYQGPNTAATFRSFWTWPYWDMDGVYFHSNTEIGQSSSLKARGFYTRYKNAIDMWSDDTYSVMNTLNAMTSHYDDHNYGASTEFTTHAVPNNILSASFFVKQDSHTETGTYPARAPYPLIQPVMEDRALLTSIGFQDKITIGSRLNATFGFSADHFNGQQAQGYNRAGTTVIPFQCLSDPNNTSFNGCTLHDWAFNPQLSVAYQVAQSGNLFVTFADRGRFPILKEIYTTGMGSGLPNPDLQPERSRNWNVGYSQLLPLRTLVQVELFRSDLRNAIEVVNITDPGGTSTATAMCPNSNIVGFCRQTVNIGEELHNGVEFQLRSTPFSRVTIDANYTYLHRTLTYDFAKVPPVSVVNTSINILPTLPENKLIGTATVQLPRRVLGMVSARYESGLAMQDTTYPTSSPLFQPFDKSFGTMDAAAFVPIYRELILHASVKNVFDANTFYTPGYPEPGRTWALYLRYQF